MNKHVAGLALVVSVTTALMTEAAGQAMPVTPKDVDTAHVFDALRLYALFAGMGFHDEFDCPHIEAQVVLTLACDAAAEQTEWLSIVPGLDPVIPGLAEAMSASQTRLASASPGSVEWTENEFRMVVETRIGIAFEVVDYPSLLASARRSMSCRVDLRFGLRCDQQPSEHMSRVLCAYGAAVKFFLVDGRATGLEAEGNLRVADVLDMSTFRALADRYFDVPGSVTGVDDPIAVMHLSERLLGVTQWCVREDVVRWSSAEPFFFFDVAYVESYVLWGQRLAARARARERGGE